MAKGVEITRMGKAPAKEIMKETEKDCLSEATDVYEAIPAGLGDDIAGYDSAQLD